MGRRIEGTITTLELSKRTDKDVSIKRIVVQSARGHTVTLSSTSAPLRTYAIMEQGGAMTLYAGGPFFFFLPSQIFGARSAAGEFFEAPQAIFWIPGAFVLMLIAVPLALLPITLLLFPLLVLAAIWAILISWSGMGARAMFKRDQRRAAKGQAG